MRARARESDTQKEKIWRRCVLKEDPVVSAVYPAIAPRVWHRNQKENGDMLDG